MRKCIAILAALAFAQGAWSQSIAIVENGAAKLPILVKDVKNPVALELQRVVKKISGAELKIATPTTASRGVFLGVASDFPWLKLVKSCFSAAQGRRTPADSATPFDERRFMSIIGMAVKNAYSGALPPQAAMDYAQKLFDELFTHG